MGSKKTLFVHKHVVKWGECDPAGIIYTPRVIDFVLEAIEAWYPAVLGTSWTEMRRQRNIGVPMVRVECDFVRPPTPGLELFVEVHVANIGGSSITYRVEGYDVAGDLYFRARMVSCFIDVTTVKPLEIADELRARMLAYQASCGDA